MGVNKVTLLQEAILSLSKEINKNGEATKQQILKKADYPSESGSKHVDDAVFRMADEKDY